MNKLQMIIDRIKKSRFLKSITINVFMRPIAMIISFLYTPILLDFLGEEAYGVWITILSITNWIGLCDIGIGNSYRNMAASDLAKNDNLSLKKTCSTAYTIFTVIISIVLGVVLLAGVILNWNRIFNTELPVRICVLVSICFTCISFVVRLYTGGYYALQRSEVPSIANCITQFLNLCVVFPLSIMSMKYNKLTIMAFVFGSTQLIVGSIYTLKLWNINNSFVPSIKCYDEKRVRSLCSLGIEFFLIQVSALVLYSTDSLIVSNVISPISVTSYSTVNRFFVIPYSIYTAMLAPFWSKCTEAKEQDNYRWIKDGIKKFVIVWAMLSVGTIIAIPIFKPFARLWLGRELYYDVGIIFVMAMYYIVQMFAGILSSVLNGLGEIKLSVVTSVTEMIVNVPLSIFLAKTVGLKSTGVALGTVIPQILACIVLGRQVLTIIRGRS